MLGITGPGDLCPGFMSSGITSLVVQVQGFRSAEFLSLVVKVFFTLVEVYVFGVFVLGIKGPGGLSPGFMSSGIT